MQPISDIGGKKNKGLENFMEAIIKVSEGQQLAQGSCIFCNEPATKIFSIIDVNDKRYNGNKITGFHVCDKHVEALNSLLDGSKDIDLLVKTFERVRTGGTINLWA